MSAWIYLIHEREFIKEKKHIYKIGRTKNIAKRLTQYPKGSQMLPLVFIFSYVFKEVYTFHKMFYYLK